MDTSSPLSLFEAVFKVIEERLPFGRQIVTTLSALMVAVLFVFCVGYLFSALSVATTWVALSFKARSFVALPHFSMKYDLFIWVFFVWTWWVVGAIAYGLFKIRRVVEENDFIIEKIKQNDVRNEKLRTSK